VDGRQRVVDTPMILIEVRHERPGLQTCRVEKLI
jgi:hypothetical protein